MSVGFDCHIVCMYGEENNHLSCTPERPEEGENDKCVLVLITIRSAENIMH